MMAENVYDLLFNSTKSNKASKNGLNIAKIAKINVKK